MQSMHSRSFSVHEKRKNLESAVKCDCVAKLSDYGFEKVGKWQMQKKDIWPVFYSTADTKRLTKRVIYAYTADSKVRYIGICLGKKTTLEARLKRHSWLHNRKLLSTNGIYRSLKRGGNVYIYAWRPEEKRHYRRLSIDLISGLEKPLMLRFKTLKEYGGWNSQY